MNYLAHALLSPEDPIILMGNLWGDLLKPKDYPVLAPKLLTGIGRHKKIDLFTDQHSAVDQIGQFLRPSQGKYTPVVADVLMDFILSKYWHLYHDEPIEIFCQNIYTTVYENLELIPERLHPRINRMLGHHWLESCKSEERMQETLLMLSRRVSFENDIPNAMESYSLHKQEMDRLFAEFFVDMQRHITLQSGG